MTNEEYEKYTSSSKFDGIGVQLMSDETMIEITKVFSNSPAHTAGLHIGDQLLAADNISLVGQNTEFATSIIRGERGTSVKLEVFRPEDGTSHVFDITRDTIVTEYVSSKIVDDDIGYIYLSEFGKDSAKDFENKLEDLKNQNVKGFILDLRQNPGGNVFDAIKISDALLPQTEIFYTLDKNSKKDLNFSDASYWDIPMVVLVDAGSASASEIVSGTLQDNKRAVVVGTKSYGKGVIQFLRPLSDGSVYKLTYQEYYFPSGKKIHGEGITPDYVVTQNEDYTNTLVDLIPEQEDSQLQKAIELLKK
jgi:carboxyl-terminal processing protease